MKQSKPKAKASRSTWFFHCSRCGHIWEKPKWMRGFIRPSGCQKCRSRYIAGISKPEYLERKRREKEAV